MPSKPEAAEIGVRVIPRSSKNKVALEPDGSLKVWVTAPPVDGEANEAVIEAINRAAHIKRSAISILAGATSRNKRVRVEGISLEALLQRFQDA